MLLRIRSRGLTLLAVIASLTSVARADEPLPDRVNFNRDIRPILSDVCFHCHGPDAAQRKADLRFDTEAGATIDLGEGRRAIVAGKPDLSELIRRIESTDPDLQMPPAVLGRPLSSRQKCSCDAGSIRMQSGMLTGRLLHPNARRCPLSKRLNGCKIRWTGLSWLGWNANI